MTYQTMQHTPKPHVHFIIFISDYTNCKLFAETQDIVMELHTLYQFLLKIVTISFEKTST